MRMPCPLSSAIDSAARKALGKEWGLYAALLDHWREIVGESYAEKTAPVKITFPRGEFLDAKNTSTQRKGSLTIRVPRGLAMEFSFHVEPIKSRVNAFFGYEAIEKIILDSLSSSQQVPPALPVERVFLPTDEKNVRQSVAHIEDEELRETLFAFGKTLFTHADD